MIDKGLLHGVQVAFAAQYPFDGSYVTALNRNDEQQTGQCALTVKMDGASAALPVVAALLRSSETDLFTQRVQHSGAVIAKDEVILPINSNHMPTILSVAGLLVTPGMHASKRVGCRCNRSRRREASAAWKGAPGHVMSINWFVRQFV
jgi:hypothetical protein